MERAQAGPRFFLSTMKDEFEPVLAEIRRRVQEMGYELVDLRQRGSRRRPVLQVRIDRVDASPGQGITHGDCTRVSRGLEGWLDVMQPLGERYVLEVSSPGVERPVRWPEHWARFRGQDVHVKLAGRGRVRATIVDVLDDGSIVLLRPQGGEETVAVPVTDARDATLAVDWS